MLNFMFNEFDKTPQPYGLFHIICFIITIIVTIILIFLSRKKVNADKIVLVFGIILVVIEVYKQILYTIEASRYQWYAFPFQFCSVPIYIAILAPFIKNKKIKDMFYNFLALFGLLAGLAVMIYPNDVFTKNISISLHTMIWHGSMVAMGIYLFVENKTSRSYKNIFKALNVYLVLIVIALFINTLSHWFLDDALNAFYISPWNGCHLPILSIIRDNTPYIVFLLCYILAFVIGVTVIFYIGKIIDLIICKKKVKL